MRTGHPPRWGTRTTRPRGPGVDREPPACPPRPALLLNSGARPGPARGGVDTGTTHARPSGPLARERAASTALAARPRPGARRQPGPRAAPGLELQETAPSLTLFPPAPATHVPDGEEDERGGEQQRQHIAEGRESERHGRGGAAGRAGASGERRRTALWVKPFTSPGLCLHRRPGLLPARLRREPPTRAPPDGRSLRSSSVVRTVDLSFIL